MENKKDTIWITIPDEANSALDTTPDNQDRVENKAFWGTGFVALIAFSILLFAPQEFAGLMKAQLFDGEFQVVPDYEEQAEDVGLGEEGEDAVEEVVTENVVEAESEAVSIQIEPLEETEELLEEEVAEEPAQEEAAEEVVTEEAEPVEVIGEAEEIVIEPVDEADADAEETDEDVDPNLALLQALSAQIEELKEQDQENQQQIQDLMALLQGQAAAGTLRGAAGEQPTTVPLGVAQGTQLGQTGQLTSPGTYRYNTHTVTISPYDVLAQNQQAAQLGQQQMVQASVAYGQVQPISTPDYSQALAGVQVQPDTGPAESLMFAFLLASIGVLAWGIARSARA